MEAAPGRVGYIPLGLTAGVVAAADRAGTLGWAGGAVVSGLAAGALLAFFHGGDLRDHPAALAAHSTARIRLWGSATLGVAVALATPAGWAGTLALELFHDGALGTPFLIGLLSLVGALSSVAMLGLGLWSVVAPDAMRAAHAPRGPAATNPRPRAAAPPPPPRPPRPPRPSPAPTAQRSPIAAASAESGCPCHRLPRDERRSPLDEPCLEQVEPEAARPLLRHGLVRYTCRETALAWDIAGWEERGVERFSYVVADDSVATARRLLAAGVITATPGFARELEQRAQRAATAR